MRRAYDSELWIENGEVIGINLGADFTSEHEWGIKGIKQSFGVESESKELGIEARMISNCPDNLLFVEGITIKKKKYFGLICLSRYGYEYYIKEKKISILDIIKQSELTPYDKDINCAWDENTFGILVEAKFENEIKQIYEAFKKKDIVIGIGSSHAFMNGGLKFAIVSKLPKEVVENIYNTDLDAINLKIAAEATGIYEILDKAGKGKYKGWMALSPRWKDDEKKEVIFWLNPEQQQIHNYGWFTVEELKEWAEDKGVIMMDKKVARQ